MGKITDKLSDKLRAISAAVSAIEKQFGKGAIMPLGGPEIVDIPVISTGSMSLDLALGVGGLPRGRVIEIFGPESSGKTTLTLHAIAACQKAGGVCAFIDAEHALDVGYAKRLGVDLANLLVSQPDCGEQALEIADQLARTGAVDLIVVDSVAALTPRAEIEGDMGDSHMGLQARLMSQALRKLTAVCAKQNTAVIFINQLPHTRGINAVTDEDGAAARAGLHGVLGLHLCPAGRGDQGTQLKPARLAALPAGDAWCGSGWWATTDLRDAIDELEQARDLMHLAAEDLHDADLGVGPCSVNEAMELVVQYARRYAAAIGAVARLGGASG